MNQTIRAICWFGKLPCIGDFCSFNMSATLLSRLDDWLSSAMQEGETIYGATWMQAYFQTPIHGFVWHENTLPTPDHTAAIGVMMPSVDKAGRAFPFILLKQMPTAQLMRLSQPALTEWFTLAHALCADALDGEWSLDKLGLEVMRLPTLEALLTDHSNRSIELPEGHSRWFRIDFDGTVSFVMDGAGLPEGPAFEKLLGLKRALP